MEDHCSQVCSACFLTGSRTPCPGVAMQKGAGSSHVNHKSRKLPPFSWWTQGDNSLAHSSQSRVSSELVIIPIMLCGLPQIVSFCIYVYTFPARLICARHFGHVVWLGMGWELWVCTVFYLAPGTWIWVTPCLWWPPHTVAVGQPVHACLPGTLKVNS